MKKLLHTFLTLLFLTTISIHISFAKNYLAIDDTLPQPYTPFPVDSAVWYESGDGAQQPFYYEWHDLYVLGGDTIFDTLQYKKIFAKQYHHEIGQPWAYYSEGFFGGLREDNKRIYYIEKFGQIERLLYDFNNLQVGDTIGNWLENWDVFNVGIEPVECRAIDSIRTFQMENGELRNAYYTSYNVIVEGMGNLKGLSSYYCPEFESVNRLNCFKHNGVVLFSNQNVNDTSENCVYNFNSIQELNTQNKISFYPNPATDKLTIEIPSGVSPHQIEITDALGRKIYSEKTNLKFVIINLKSFSAGIYFLKVELEDGSVTVRKFVKE